MMSWIIVAISCLLARGALGAVPDFGAQTATVSVAEDTATGTALTFASDPTITGDPASIEILGTSTAGAQTTFSVALNAAKTGMTLTLISALDFEATASYTVNVRITNADGNSGDDGAGDLVVTVTVTDVNDNTPTFNPMYMCQEWMADTAAGTAIATMAATDPDAAPNDLATNPYAFTSGTATAATTKFDVAAASGAVTVASGQTLEAGGAWTMYIQAPDGAGTPLTGTATLSVCVGAGCCTSGAVVIQGALAVVVLGLLSLFM